MKAAGQWLESHSGVYGRLSPPFSAAIDRAPLCPITLLRGTRRRGRSAPATTARAAPAPAQPVPPAYPGWRGWRAAGRAARAAASPSSQRCRRPWPPRRRPAGAPSWRAGGPAPPGQRRHPPLLYNRDDVTGHGGSPLAARSAPPPAPPRAPVGSVGRDCGSMKSPREPGIAKGRSGPGGTAGPSAHRPAPAGSARGTRHSTALPPGRETPHPLRALCSTAPSLHSKEVLSHVQVELPGTQFRPTVSCPGAWHHRAEPGSVLLTPPCRH